MGETDLRTPNPYLTHPSSSEESQPQAPGCLSLASLSWRGSAPSPIIFCLSSLLWAMPGFLQLLKSQPWLSCLLESTLHVFSPLLLHTGGLGSNRSKGCCPVPTATSRTIAEGSRKSEKTRRLLLCTLGTWMVGVRCGCVTGHKGRNDRFL